MESHPPLVPHNFEGFFLNLGDMLAKQGDAEGARRALEAAQRSPDYDTWRYAPELKRRLASLDERVARFAAATKLVPPSTARPSSNCSAMPSEIARWAT